MDLSTVTSQVQTCHQYDKELKLKSGFETMELLKGGLDRHYTR